jgi:hypothetical protein
VIDAFVPGPVDAGSLRPKGVSKVCVRHWIKREAEDLAKEPVPSDAPERIAGVDHRIGSPVTTVKEKGATAKRHKSARSYTESSFKMAG